MKDCETCGNEISDVATTCRFCNSAVSFRAAQGSQPRIREINIKEGRPTVREGLDRLEFELERARRSGVRMVKIIHGYGASGVGGKLCIACRAYLSRQVSSGRIKRMIEGDGYSPTNPAGRALIQRFAALRRTCREDSGNPGITFVEL